MIDARLQDVWYGDKPPGLLLRTLEKVYTSVSSRRQAGLRPDPALLDKPIVVVGNITAGGTGKTPLVIHIVQLLQNAGRKVAVVSRGYGRDSSAPIRVDEQTSPKEGGDEPVLIARRCGVPVYVDSDREAAARLAFEGGADIVVADDGLQRLSLPRVLELCVVDGQRGFGNGRLMPAGPLREPLKRLESVDSIVINGAGEVEGWQGEAIQMGLSPTRWVNLAGNEFADPQSSGTFGPCTALAGTGNPQRFFSTLQSLGFKPEACKAFPDHHQFSKADFESFSGRLLMTEKDAVKCRDLQLEDAWYLEVDASLPEAWDGWILDQIAQVKT